MEIIGQSTYTAKVPYLHLGYVAATTLTKPDMGLTAGGITSILLGGAVLLGLLKRLRYPSTRPRPVRLGVALTGVILIVSGFVCMQAAKHGRKTVMLYPKELTRANAIEFFRKAQSGPATQPHRAGGFASKLLPRDAWENPMRLENVTAGEVSQRALRSAGEDGAFDTTDDIVVTEHSTNIGRDEFAR